MSAIVMDMKPGVMVEIEGIRQPTDAEKTLIRNLVDTVNHLDGTSYSWVESDDFLKEEETGTFLARVNGEPAGWMQLFGSPGEAKELTAQVVPGFRRQGLFRRFLEAGYRKAYADNAAVYHSHDYGILEQCRRSFDESRSFKQSFGYDLSPNVFYVFARSAVATWADWRYAWSNGMLFSGFSWVLKSPFLNLSRHNCSSLHLQSHQIHQQKLMKLTSFPKS